MSRIHRYKPEELNEEQRKIYTEITTGKRARNTGYSSLVDDEGRLEGPFNAMLLNPVFGDILQQLGAAIRYQGVLSDRSRELAILIVAAHWHSQFAQRTHEQVGARVGLTEDEMRVLRNGEIPLLEDDEEKAVIWAVRRLLENPELSDEEYSYLVETLTTEKLFELTVLVGHYSLLAMQMHVFGVS